ncbi:MAG: aldo/keto reductase [Ilumatobacter sp.]|uniref:aldo/keto reductase n=1 Tax=Ilumatobacter sp. TaxID=1967498 RepID=UPI003298B5F1
MTTGTPDLSIHDTTTFDLGGATSIRRLGYGAMQLTGEGVWGVPEDRDGAIAVLRSAVEMGVNFIDTADSYGPEVSETLIGEALAPYADDVVIATKAGLVRPGPGDWQPDGRPEHIRQACEGSLERLKLDRIPLYQLHRIDPDVPVAESIGTMLELREEGKIDMIGVSEVTVDELRQVQRLCDVAAVQNRFNVGDREWSDVVDACAADGIAFIPWFPLGSDDLGDAVEALDTVADAHGATRHGVALAWLLHRSSTMVPIPGTKTMTHLVDNVSSAHLVDAVTDDEWAMLDALA